jgi:acetyl-CoA carboxylase biotin carboxyl carrier protein
MPDPRPTGDRTPAQRQADHASLARLSESLVPALVQKLSASGLGELEVREGDWRIRLRRAAPSPVGAPRRTDRPRLGSHADRDARGREVTSAAPIPAAGGARHDEPQGIPASPRRTVVTSPTVGVFRAEAAVGARVRAGDRIASVDLLGIGQDVIAPIDGTVVEVFPQAGEAVEYGEEVAAVESDVTVETHGPAVASAGDEGVADAPDEGAPGAGGEVPA